MKHSCKLSVLTLIALFFSLNNTNASIDTGLGIGNGGAVINGTEGGFVNTSTVNGVANLNFQGDTHVTWDSFNINSNETMNFNAVNNSSGFTVLNTVNNGMSNIYGRINIDPSIGKVILSNPNGVLFDGTKFNVVAGNNFVVTTAQMTSLFNNGKMSVTQLPFTDQSGNVTFQHLKYNEFFIDGEFTIIAPKIFFDGSNGFKFVTSDGANFVYKLEEDNSHIPITIEVSGLEPYDIVSGNSSDSGAGNGTGDTNSNTDTPNCDNTDTVGDNTNNDNPEIVIDAQVEPWEDGGEIVVGEDDNDTISQNTDSGNTDVIDDNTNNGNPEIVIDTQVEPWEDGGEITVGEDDNDTISQNTDSGNTDVNDDNTNNENPEIVIDTQVEPWEDGGEITVDTEYNGIIYQAKQLSDNSVQISNKNLKELEVSTDQFNVSMVENYANNETVDVNVIDKTDDIGISN